MGYVWGKTSIAHSSPSCERAPATNLFRSLELPKSRVGSQSLQQGKFAIYNRVFKIPTNSLSTKTSRFILGWCKQAHRSTELKIYLYSLNQDLPEDAWAITCIRLAPNAPEQNPVEDIWLQAKRFIRKCYHLCKSFTVVQFLFEFVTHRQVFDFPKLSMYGVFL